MPRTRLIEIITFIFLYCYILNFTIQEELLYQKSCFNVFNRTYCKELLDCKNNTMCGDAQSVVQKHSAKWTIYLNLAGELPSIFMALVFGVCSDKLGRKIFLLLPIIGYLISSSTLALFSYFDMSIAYLLLGNFISGFFGGFASFLSSAYSYVADITTEKNRTFRIVLLESVDSLAGVLASITGGLMVTKLGFVYVYCFVSGLYVLQIIYWFFLKETHPRSPEFRFSINSVFGEQGFRSQLGIFTSGMAPNFRKCLIIALGCFFLATFTLFGVARSQYKFVLHDPFNFSPTTVGYFGATSNGAAFVSAVIIDLVCFYWWKLQDSTVLVFGNVGLIGYALCIGLSKTTIAIFLCRLWALIYGATLPSIRSIISKMFAAGDQGKVFAIISFIEAITHLISDVFSSYVYGSTVSTSPSIVFFILASFAGLLLIASIALVMMRVSNNYRVLEVADTDETDKTVRLDAECARDPGPV